MKTHLRYLQAAIVNDLKKKMVFIGGPRQVGKTTLAHLIGAHTGKSAQYLSWDDADDRKKILSRTFSSDAKLLIFDELHKYHEWKNYIKGIYDTHKESFSIIVTGSARLDLYRKGGDSLLGRYHYFCLHPFSLAELRKKTEKTKPSQSSQSPKSLKSLKPFKPLIFASPTPQDKKHLALLDKFGGFPEPLFSKEGKTTRRWHNERMDRLVKEDIRDATFIRDISSLQILVELLMEKAGGQLLMNALREDIKVTHKTIADWVDVLETFYVHYRIYPFAQRTIQSLVKEPKIYFWDWSSITDEGRRFENLIASHLLKFTHYLHDSEGYNAQLFYLRDTTGREVDFLVTIDKKPWFAVEAKLADTSPSRHLDYFAQRLNIPFCFQVIKQSNIDLTGDKTRIISADKFLTGLV